MFTRDEERTPPGHPPRDARGVKFGRGGARTLREARGAGAGDSGPAGRALTTHAEQRHGRGADQPPPHLSRSPRRAAPSFLLAGAAPPRAVCLAGPAATHGARRRPRSPLPRSRPGSHGRSEQRKGLRLRRPTEDWARPRGAIAEKRERPELPPVTRAGIRARVWARPSLRATPPANPLAPSLPTTPPQERVDNEVRFIFLICEIESSSAH